MSSATTIPLYQNDCANSPGSIVVKNNYNDNGLALVFCDHWFSLGKLSAAYGNARGGKNMYDLREYDNRAVPWLSALFQINTIGTFPTLNGNPVMTHRKIRYPDSPYFQWVSDPTQTKYLAKYYQDPNQVVLTWSNLDNWAWYSLATYVQGKSGEYPQRPLAPKELPPSPVQSSPLFATVNGSTLTDDDEGELNALSAAYGVSEVLTVQQ